MLPVVVHKVLLLVLNGGRNRIISVSWFWLAVRRCTAANKLPQNWDQKDG